MVIMDETDKLRLSHLYEHVQLLDKESNQILFTDDFYGDPSCGLIDVENEYSIIAGKHLTLWTIEYGISNIITFETLEFCDIEQLRLINRDTVEILVDPWSEYSAIWQLTIPNKSLFKVSSFIGYKYLPYNECISW